MRHAELECEKGPGHAQNRRPHGLSLCTTLADSLRCGKRLHVCMDGALSARVQSHVCVGLGEMHMVCCGTKRCDWVKHTLCMLSEQAYAWRTNGVAATENLRRVLSLGVLGTLSARLLCVWMHGRGRGGKGNTCVRRGRKRRDTDLPRQEEEPGRHHRPTLCFYVRAAMGTVCWCIGMPWPACAPCL